MAPPRMSGKAVASLCLAVAGPVLLCLAVVPAFLHPELGSPILMVTTLVLLTACAAVLTGVLARREMRTAGGALRGGGLALAGIVVGTGIAALMLILAGVLAWAAVRYNGG